VQAALAAHDLALSTADALARLPRGYDAARGTELEPMLKLRHWIVRRPLPEEAFASEAVVDRLVSFAEDSASLLRFGWAAIAA
jgi:uncharacterized protein (DUF2461 family)